MANQESTELSNIEYQIEIKAMQATKAGNHPLTVEAFKTLIGDLRRYGNKMGNNQCLALYELLTEMTAFSLGIAHGRKAYSLPTGCGKTSAIIAWISTLSSMNLSDISVSVSAFTVGALCDIKTALIEHGVPEKEVGIKYSKNQSWPYPSTGNESRRIQLVTHARVSGGIDDELFIKHQGIPRELMIYDESLIKANSGAMLKNYLSADVAALTEIVKGTLTETAYAPLIVYLKTVCEKIELALERVSQNPSDVRVIELPELKEEEISKYMELAKGYPNYSHIPELLENTDKQLRVGTSNQGNGIVWYEISIPEELKNILILDASYPIRRLVHLDSSIIQGSKYKGLVIKRFDKVAIHEMKVSSGRGAMQKSFAKISKEERNVSREIVEVIKNTEMSKAILVVSFKRNYKDIDIQNVLLNDLKEAGVDTEQAMSGGTARINFLTWGNETSLNTLSHCEVVIIAGVLRLPSLTLASKIIGQKDDINATTPQ